jgi:chromate reductase, NAD(P)H dehydrogenase (quinone)
VHCRKFAVAIAQHEPCKGADQLLPAATTLTIVPTLDTFPLFNADNCAAVMPASMTAFADLIQAADAVIIVSPEYNFSVPGVLGV